MKQLIYRFILIFFTATLYMSCSQDDDAIVVDASDTCNDGILNGDEIAIDCGGSCEPCPPANALGGVLVDRLVLDPNIVYILNEPLLVRDGAILEIPAGTVIKAQSHKNLYIAVAQGGKFYAWGSADNPVILTSDSESPAAGDWGGLVICGKAPTNYGNLARSELLDIFYGGDSTNDSSGVIRYLRIEYTGETFRNSKHFNGMTLYGVGAFTTLHHIQTYEALGNGFEIVGGTVNPQQLVATNSAQNALLIDGGWNGQGTDWFLVNSHLAGIELSNNQKEFTATPQSAGALKNVSIVGASIETAINYRNGGGTFTISDVFTSNMNFGINVGSELESNLIDANYLKIERIQFSTPNSGFSTTNYSGSNANFYTTEPTTGAGNSGSQPEWALNWTVGF